MQPELFTNDWILIYGGLVLTLVIVFTETAFPIGAIIPGGEMLLFITGMIAGTRWLNINILFIIIPITLIAFIGNLTGYSIGCRKGHRLFEKNGWFLKQKYLNRTDRFREKFGMLSFILSHFIPVIRTYHPLINGAREVNFQSFFLFSGIGCVVYVNVMIISGYFIGKFFPALKMNLQYIILAVLVFIFITPVISLLRTKLEKIPKEDAFHDE